MPTLLNYKDLFREATLEDKLSFFQTLLNGKEDLTADLALALLKSVHKELSSTHHNYLAYKRYAGVIESLRYEMSDLLLQVVDAWNAGRTAKEIEWLADGVIK
ncbi:MAG: hypothetical protein IH588_14385 [Anaerolineales bacterium]|nr:hypothetical protein [Anaerolineales bacterium]